MKTISDNAQYTFTSTRGSKYLTPILNREIKNIIIILVLVLYANYDNSIFMQLVFNQYYL